MGSVRNAGGADVARSAVRSGPSPGMRSETVTKIARALKTTRKSVLKWIDKALQMGVKAGIMDTPHKPREAVITDDAKAWGLIDDVMAPRQKGDDAGK